MLIFRDGAEVAVIYQRCLYTPTDFVSEETWKCRLMMERSKAILCPNAGYHLAGTKKVQQVLSKPGVLERFVENVEMREKIRKTFMRMCSLEKVNCFSYFQGIQIAFFNSWVYEIWHKFMAIFSFQRMKMETKQLMKQSRIMINLFSNLREKEEVLPFNNFSSLQPVIFELEMINLTL